MASRYGMSMCSTIRVVHPECVYSNTRLKTMIAMDLNDHWLPFQDLEEYMMIPMEMAWDNMGLALTFFRDYIKHNQHTKGVHTK